MKLFQIVFHWASCSFAIFYAATDDANINYRVRWFRLRYDLLNNTPAGYLMLVRGTVFWYLIRSYLLRTYVIPEDVQSIALAAGTPVDPYPRDRTRTEYYLGTVGTYLTLLPTP